MVFYHLTIAIESMVLQSTIGDDGFSMVIEEKNDDGFQKLQFTTKNNFYEFKLPTDRLK